MVSASVLDKTNLYFEPFGKVVTGSGRDYFLQVKNNLTHINYYQKTVSGMANSFFLLRRDFSKIFAMNFSFPKHEKDQLLSICKRMCS